MLTNLWYVAEWSKAVADKPVKAKLLGQNFVLYRDKSGKVHCLSDICIHRGGSLQSDNNFAGPIRAQPAKDFGSMFGRQF